MSRPRFGRGGSADGPFSGLGYECLLLDVRIRSKFEPRAAQTFRRGGFPCWRLKYLEILVRDIKASPRVFENGGIISVQTEQSRPGWRTPDREFTGTRPWQRRGAETNRSGSAGGSLEAYGRPAPPRLVGSKTSTNGAAFPIFILSSALMVDRGRAGRSGVGSDGSREDGRVVMPRRLRAGVDSYPFVSQDHSFSPKVLD